MTLSGEFSAHREPASGELTTVPIAHPLFEGAQARVPVKTDRPLARGPLELLKWIQERMPMFSAAREGNDAPKRNRRLRGKG
ncbi:hypothetical protein LMG27177_04499 [Paraburkholderia fynbosensis]|uniref:Uncharacterized protein n=1 Tax=Paraburkholderia fynbosensis TaxID=1200993 RepID=A0A6J5GK63_9BURK|nr:hypothetical protein LMG27177_04499 [Paraburkholderia fynbosensis]